MLFSEKSYSTPVFPNKTDSSEANEVNAQQLPLPLWTLTEDTRFSFLKSYDAGNFDVCKSKSLELIGVITILLPDLTFKNPLIVFAAYTLEEPKVNVVV